MHLIKLKVTAAWRLQKGISSVVLDTVSELQNGP
jgi:hypothetical protein